MPRRAAVCLLAPILALTSAACGTPRTYAPEALLAHGEPLPLEAGTFGTSTVLDGFRITNYTASGIPVVIMEEELTVDGAARFTIERDGVELWRVLCPMRASNIEAPGADLVCFMNPLADAPPMMVVLTGQLFDPLAGVFVESASVAYQLSTSGGYQSYITRGTTVRRPGHEGPLAYVSMSQAPRLEGYVARDTSTEERERLAPLLLTLSGALDPRRRSVQLKGDQEWRRNIAVEPQELEAVPELWRPAVELLLASGYTAEARAVLDVMKYRSLEGLAAPHPLLGPDLRPGVDRLAFTFDLLCLGLRLPNGEHQGLAATLWFSAGMLVMDFVQVYLSLETRGTGVRGPPPALPADLVAELTTRGTIRLSAGLRLTALRIGAASVLAGVELSAVGATERLEGAVFEQTMELELYRPGTVVAPTLALRYMLGESADGGYGYVQLEGRADRTRWSAGKVEILDANGSFGTLVAEQVAADWAANDRPIVTWSGGLRFILGYRF